MKRPSRIFSRYIDIIALLNGANMIIVDAKLSNYVVSVIRSWKEITRGIYVWIVCLLVIYSFQSVNHTLYLSLAFNNGLFAVYLLALDLGKKPMYFANMEKMLKIDIKNQSVPFCIYTKTRWIIVIYEAVYVLAFFLHAHNYDYFPMSMDLISIGCTIINIY